MSMALTAVSPEPYRDRVATTEVQNAWSSRDSRRLQIVFFIFFYLFIFFLLLKSKTYKTVQNTEYVHTI